jgi:FKBP-type peptidyl-prolyl cis-trans isomerase SlyD
MQMKVGPNTTVFFEYRLLDEDGMLLESSPEDQPLDFVFGEGSIIPGLESGMEGMEPGESKDVVVKPEEAYGLRDPGLVQKISKERFAGATDLEVGKSYTARTDAGQIVNFRIIAIDDENMEIDLNHPLAGMNLRFQVTVKDVSQKEA